MGQDDVVGVMSVATGRDEDIASVVESLGVDRVAKILTDEIVSRFERPQVSVCSEIVVQLCFTHGGRKAGYVVRLGPSDVAWAPGDVEQPDARVEQEFSEAVRAVFGPGGSSSLSTRRVELRGAETLEAFKEPPSWFYVAQRLLATMDARDGVGLAELASRYGSDKWGIHRYAEHYERHFAPLRDRPLTVLEIGVGGMGFDDPTKGGASLRMWKRYFLRALIYGVDIVDKRALSEQRITVLRADQSDPAELAGVVETTGPLDIIIDDGSHVNEHVLTSFRTLFPHLRNGGLYVIEDLQTSYWPRFGGTSTSFDSPSTSVGFLKSLVDGLNYEEILESSGRSRKAFDRAIKGLHFYHNIAFVEKGLNADGGGPDWVRYGRK